MDLCIHTQRKNQSASKISEDDFITRKYLRFTTGPNESEYCELYSG